MYDSKVREPSSLKPHLTCGIPQSNRKRSPGKAGAYKNTDIRSHCHPHSERGENCKHKQDRHGQGTKRTTLAAPRMDKLRGESHRRQHKLGKRERQMSEAERKK